LVARKKRIITEEELTVRDNLAGEVARMLTSLIKYLLKATARPEGWDETPITDAVDATTRAPEKQKLMTDD
jgi:hypothetical protein